MQRLLLLASVLGFTAVALGAFGAHGLERRFAERPDRKAIWNTAVQYHSYHALAVLALAAVAGRRPGRLVAGAGGLFGAGVLLFSGSLYALALSGVRGLGAVTPFGGLAFLTGWALLGVAAMRRPPTA